MNNKIISSMILEGYEGCRKKFHNPLYVWFFGGFFSVFACNFATLISHMNQQRKHLMFKTYW